MLKRYFESQDDILSNLDQNDYRPSDGDLRTLFNLFNSRFFQSSLPKCNLFNYNRLGKDQLGCFYFNPTVARSRIDGICKRYLLQTRSQFIRSGRNKRSKNRTSYSSSRWYDRRFEKTGKRIRYWNRSIKFKI